MDAVGLELIPLLAAAFVAGLVDAAVGGGGLVQLPSLFAALPTLPPPTLLGTNKLASMTGTATATWRYARSTPIAWRLVGPAAACAFAASFAGARAVSALPREGLRPLVLVLLVVMLAYTLKKKDFGAVARPPALDGVALAKALAVGGGIGFYDGFFGPGTGSFLVFTFIRFFGLDFVRASAASKVVNLATNLAALAHFVPAGHVAWGYALPMAASNVAGAVVGARIALRGGAPVVRRLFVGVVVALIAKLAIDVVGAWR